MNNNDEINIKENNRRLSVGPSFCCKTHFLLNKLQLIRLDNPNRKYVSIREILNNTETQLCWSSV